MKMKRINKSLSCFLCIVLIAAMALFTTGCSDKETNESGKVNSVVTPTTEGTQATPTESTENTNPTETPTPTEAAKENVLGEGNTKFTFVVVGKDGNQSEFEIHTDEKVVGDALVANELIAGEEGDYGLYVKTVNGITLDYDTDGMYWAFYIDGEYAMTGVDMTDITDGATYTFKAEK